MRSTTIVLLFAAAALRGQDPYAAIPLDTAEDRYTALLFFEDARVASPAAWQRLLAAKGEPAFLARVVRGLGRVGDPALREVMRGVLTGPEKPWPSDLRRASALAVGLLGDPDLLALLAQRVGAADLMRAVGLLGRLPEGEDERTMVLHAVSQPSPPGDPDPATITDSVEARLTYGAQVTEPLFLDLARDVLKAGEPEGQVRAALYYLHRHPKKPPREFADLVARHVLDADVEAAGFAARALARGEESGEDEAGLLAAAYLHEGPRGVQIERLRALAALPPMPARPALLAAFKDPYPHLRRTALETAAGVAGKLAADDRRGFALFALAMSEDDPVTDVRRAAVLALAALDEPTFVKRLPLYRLADPWPVRAAAAEALRGLVAADWVAQPWLRWFLGDPDRRVRIAGLETIVELLKHTDRIQDLPAALAALRDLVFPEGRCPRVMPEDPVLLGLLAQAGQSFARLSADPRLGNCRVDAEKLLGRLIDLISEHEVEPLQAVLDLAGAVENEVGTEVLRRLARSSEIALRQQANGRLRQRGLEPEPLPARGEAQEAVLPLLPWRLRARTVIAGAPVSAEIKTNRGVIHLRLLKDDAPATVDDFGQLAKDGFFNGLLFHRVVPDFVVQAGCPRGDGWGGPGHTIRCEITDRSYRRGTVGMALAGKDTGGSQWFITHAAAPHLDLKYTIFGEVSDGLDVVDALVPGDVILAVTVEN